MTEPLSQNTDVPILQGWMGLSEAADFLGLSRQYIYRLAQDGKFKSLHRIGNSATTVISLDELKSFNASRRRPSGE
jgi:excisionase family DNA binding protein